VKPEGIVVRITQAALAFALALGLGGCQLGGNKPQTSSSNGSKTLTVKPSSMNFGNVVVGSTVSMNGTITAMDPLTISSASWNGSGYALSGITFPLMLSAGQSVPFTVSFTPPGGGTSTGTVSFLSDGVNSPTSTTLTGSGIHNVDLTWNLNQTQVAGYNIYRALQSGGPYSKLNSSLKTGTTYSDRNVQAGQTYYYVTTAVSANLVESSYSNQATAVIPVP
jgi:hypothetical protein